MENEINGWLKSHHPDLYKTESDLVTQNKINAVMNMATENVISIAQIAAKEKEELEKADDQVSELYREQGKEGNDFIQAFTRTPTTAMATLLSLAQLRANFLPARGKYSLSSFNQFMQNTGACPFIQIGQSDSHKVEQIFDTIEEILLSLEKVVTCDKKILRKKLTEILPTDQKKTVKLDIYIMTLGNCELNVNAASVTINVVEETTRSGKKKKDEFCFDTSYNSFELNFSFKTATWSESYAKQVASTGFYTIKDWLAASSLS